MTIRLTTLGDVEALDTHLPLDTAESHAERVQCQADGEHSYWTAWQNDIPIGHVMVRWTGFRFGPLPARFSDTPVILRLRVWPSRYRGQGIATALMSTVEQAATVRGYSAIGLGVEIDNVRARRLYEHLGYVEWSGGALCERVVRRDSDGNAVPYDEVFTVWTKELAA